LEPIERFDQGAHLSRIEHLPAVASRLALVRRILPDFGKHPKISAAFVHGSVARGTADQYSDIELGFVWSKDPGTNDLAPLALDLGRSNCDFKYVPEKQAWTETFLHDGLRIDVGHWSASAIASILSDVVVNFDTDIEKQTTVSVICESLVLHGDHVMAAWRKQATPYPSALAAKVIAQNLCAIGPWESRQMLAERNEIPLLYENHCRTIRRMLNILLALNGRYYSSFKWTRQQCDNFFIAPPELFARLERVFQSDVVSGSAELTRLVSDMLTLTESLYPSAELTEARARFSQPYPVWNR
jgi:hypothetical protein